jgi:hypothetical protein
MNAVDAFNVVYNGGGKWKLYDILGAEIAFLVGRLLLQAI